MKLGLLAFLFFTIYAASILACRHHDEDSSSVGSDEQNCRHHHHHHHHRGHRHHNCEEADESESGSTDKCKCRHSHHDDSEASKEDKTYESNDDEGSAEDEQSTEEEDVDDTTDAQETEKTEEVETEEVVLEETEEVVSEETEEVASEETEEVVSEETEEVVSEETEEVALEETEEVVSEETEEVVSEETEEAVSEETEEVVSEETEEVVSKETEEEVTAELEEVVTEEPEDVVTAEPEKVVTEEPEKEKCPIDLVFVVDTSESVGESYLATIKSVLNFVVDSTHVSRGYYDNHLSRVGIVSTSSDKNLILRLGQHTDLQSLKTAINNLEFTTTDTNLERGIRIAASQLHFARLDVPRFLVAITDGYGGSDFKEINNIATSFNITLLAVGVGRDFAFSDLLIAADRNQNGVFNARYEDEMNRLRETIEKCKTSRDFDEDEEDYRQISSKLFVY